jgi:hypothetical protein
MRYIHVYTGRKSNEMSPQTTSQGDFRIESVTWKRADRLAFISSTLPRLLHRPKHLGNDQKHRPEPPGHLGGVNSHCLTACKASNWLISCLLKSKRSSSISSNCRLLLTNCSCIWFREYAKATIVSFARGLANFSTH